MLCNAQEKAIRDYNAISIVVDDLPISTPIGKAWKITVTRVYIKGLHKLPKSKQRDYIATF